MILNSDKDRTQEIYKSLGIDVYLTPEKQDPNNERNHLVWFNAQNLRFIDSLLEKGWLEIFRHRWVPPIAISPEFAKQYGITIDSTDEDITVAFEKHFNSEDKSITATV
jgi:hypothetical protein